MEEATQEKFNKTLLFFSENKIDIPIDVKNALEDVFTENGIINDVDIYFQEDRGTMEEELIIVNEVEAYLHKSSAGSIQNIFTYYGDIDYSVSEFTTLYENDETIIEEITNINKKEIPSRIDPTKWAIILIENVEWGEGTIIKTLRLYIYCPESGVDIE